MVMVSVDEMCSEMALAEKRAKERSFDCWPRVCTMPADTRDTYDMRRLFDALERMVLRQQETLDRHANIIHRLRLEVHLLKRKGGDNDERWPSTDAHR